MNIEPIIDARFSDFRQSNELTDVPDGTAFERFVNHAILSIHQPDAFGADSTLMDSISVGGHNDTGIDGIAIKLNGLFVTSVDDVNDIVSTYGRANIEFIFIQSKHTTKFDSAEFQKFAAGVRDFLSETHLQPQNDAVKEALKTKDYLLSDELVRTWEGNPAIRVYYVAMGKWRDSPHLLAHAEQLRTDLAQLPTYGDCNIHFVDVDALKGICDSNANKFSASIATIDTLSLPSVEHVEDSCIALCYANELIKLVTTDEGVIRKSLFNDNVRDFQGSNAVNAEIESTIFNNPEKFGLLNNGITIVCDSYVPANRRITIKNPQIVNGCQTSHVLFNAGQRGAALERVPVQIKIISTKNADITNQIVRGTNRQNIVLDEAFEATREFHKDLEELFLALGREYTPIYYERRLRQYQHDPRIKQTDKVNLRVLTQVVIGMFLNKPHMSHRHEAKLIKEFEKHIYQESHSKLPYFTAASTFLAMERLFRQDIINKRQYYSYRAHISMVLRQIISGAAAALSNERAIDERCRKILSTLNDSAATSTALRRAVELFDRTRAKWVSEMRKSAYGIKDIPEFTELLISECGHAPQVIDAEEDGVLRGIVMKIIRDRRGEYNPAARRRARTVPDRSGACRSHRC